MPEQWRRLHPATIFIVFLEQGKSLLTLIFFVFIARFAGSSKGGSSILGDLVFVGIGFMALIPAVFRYLTVRFTIADGAFTITSGLFFRQKRVIPLERIQNVSLKRNLVQRMLGVTTLEVETASGAGAEAQLSVVGEKDAHLIADELQQRTGDRYHGSVEGEDPPIYKASLGQLLLSGATQNKAALIIVFFAGILNYARELISFERLPSMIAPWLPSAQGAIGVAFLGLVLLLIAGWFLSMITETIVNYGFELRREGGMLKLSHGLFTQIRATLPVRRIQSVRVVAPALQRLLGLCNVYADSAASYSEASSGGAARLAPIIERQNLQGLLDVVFPAVRLKEVAYRQVSPLAKRRSFVRNTIFGLVILGAAEAFLGPIAFAGIPVVIALGWFAAAKRYQVLGYARADGFLLTRDGVWKRTITALPENRVQWVHFTQGPVQRRMGICSLQIISAASGMSSSLQIPDLPAEVGRRLRDEIAEASAATAGAL